jgi:hypothetical protein
LCKGDFKLKELTTGVELVSSKPFQCRTFTYDKRVLDLGLKPREEYDRDSHNMIDSEDSLGRTDRNRNVIVVKDVDIKTLKDANEGRRFIEISKLRMGCESTQQVLGEDGCLIDNVI